LHSLLLERRRSMRINPAKRILTIKIVYYGPGLSGKTTNLMKLHERFPHTRRGALVKLDTESERTLFFDYFPLSLGKVREYRVKVDFFTVPGQSFYHLTRKAVLDGADGIIFVADSSSAREEANIVSRADMIRNLELLGVSYADLPHVYQWNKRDVCDAIPASLMQATLNPEGAPAIPAVARQDQGVWEAHTLLLGKVLGRLRGETEATTARLHA